MNQHFTHTVSPFPKLFADNHTFSAKERDLETGLSYFGARYYSSDLSIWLSVDPQAAKYPSLSPYVYCADNPVKLVDPNGEEINPIYDTHGNFLGTDDEGLTGKAIVMKKENFKQGMSHKDALSNNLGSKGLVDEDAQKKLLEHYSGLKERPDYDGYLTKAEADAWWRGKSGQPLYVDQSKIELPGITTQSFVDEGKNYIYKNFIVNVNNTGKVYGTLKLTLIDEKTGEVHIGGPNHMDKYDFKMDGRRFRDFATRVGRPGGENDGKDFLIYGYGHATVPVVTPKKK
ncbi:MAG: RHS repeat-associated core domain-containing protein [Bacteroidales bacterium]|nr:RHS repeat-associated core domain-containing protein [Bacteroidales bacterium]